MSKINEEAPSETPNTSSFVETERRLASHGKASVVFVVSDYNGVPASGSCMPPVLPPPALKEAKGNHWLVAASSLCNTAIGAGVLAYPYAFQQSGLIGGVVLTPVIASLMGYSLYVVVKMGERYNARSILELIRKALGKKLAAFVSYLLIVYIFGSVVCYMVIAGDTATSLVASLVGVGSVYATREVVLPALTVAVIFPLCLLRKLGHLAAINAFAIVGFIYAATLVAVVGLQTTLERSHPLRDIQLFKLDMGLLFSIPIFLMGFTCHSNSVSIFYELGQPGPPKGGLRSLVAAAMLTRSLRLQAMITALIAAFTTCVFFYVGVGAIGYLAWPYTVTGNILNILPENNFWVQLARACIGVVVVNHVPMSHFPARASFEHLLRGRDTAKVIHPALSTLFTTVFLAGSAAVSIKVTDLGFLVHLLGGTAAGMVVFCVPGLLLMNASVVKHSRLSLQGQHNAAEGDDESTDAGDDLGLHLPLLDAGDQEKLQRAAESGLKATGPLVFVPRNSWAVGVCLISVALGLISITVLSTILK